jgi:hypothetical protein
MRTLKIIYHGCIERVSTTNVHHISNLSVQKGYESSEVSYIDVFWGNGASTTIQLPNEKAYELYDKLASWLSNGATNLEVELVYGLSGDAIDYIADEK